MIKNKVGVKKGTSVAAPSSSLYPSFSTISCMAVRSVLRHASPSGERGVVEALLGIPIS